MPSYYQPPPSLARIRALEVSQVDEDRTEREEDLQRLLQELPSPEQTVSALPAIEHVSQEPSFNQENIDDEEPHVNIELDENDLDQIDDEFSRNHAYNSSFIQDESFRIENKSHTENAQRDHKSEAHDEGEEYDDIHVDDTHFQSTLSYVSEEIGDPLGLNAENDFHNGSVTIVDHSRKQVEVDSPEKQTEEPEHVFIQNAETPAPTSSQPLFHSPSPIAIAHPVATPSMAQTNQPAVTTENQPAQPTNSHVTPAPKVPQVFQYPDYTPSPSMAQNTMPSYSLASSPAQYLPLLNELREECHRLRSVNDRLVAMHDDQNREIQVLRREKDEAVRNMRQEYQITTDTLKKTYEEKINQLETENRNLRATQTQVSTIRTALEQEKELDILNLKKEIMAEKEKQLCELQKEFMHEKEETMKLMKMEIQKREDQIVAARTQIDRLKDELDTLKKSNLKETRSLSFQVDLLGQTLSQPECSQNKLLLLQQENESLRFQLDQMQQQMDVTKILQSPPPPPPLPMTEIISKKDHIAALQALRNEHIRELSHRTVQLADRDIMQRPEVQALIKKLKEQATKSYEAAIAKLKQSYKTLESKLLSRLADEKAEWKAVEKQKMVEESVLLRKELKQLKVKLEEAEKKSEDDVRQLRQQYLTTLKSMRDDVAASKQRSLQRMEKEWEKRKRDIDAAWEKKVADLKVRIRNAPISKQDENVRGQPKRVK